MRRRKRGQQDSKTTIPSYDKAASKLSNDPTKKLDGPIHPSNSAISGVFYIFAVFAGIAALLFVIYFCWKAIKCYVAARTTEAVVELVSPHPPQVGQTITCRIRFQRNGRLIPGTSETFKEFREHCKIELANGNGVLKNIATLTEVSTENGILYGKFSLRKSGEYEVFVKYIYFKLVPRGNQPCTITVFPGPPCYKNIDFGTHNPNVLCLTQGEERFFKIAVNDEYGNNCRLDDVDLSKFTFKLFRMGIMLTPEECEFCQHEDTSSFNQHQTEDSIENPMHICLKLRFDDPGPGIYICALAYDDHEIPHYQDSPKLVVCITPEEEAELRGLFSQAVLPGTLLYACPCQITAPENDETPRLQAFVGVSYSSLCLATYRTLLLVYPNFKFPVNAKTKLIVSWNHYANVVDQVFSIMVEDGLRQSIWIEVESLMARMLLVCYAQAQGHTLGNIGITFDEKRKLLKYKMTPYFPSIPMLNPTKILNVQHGRLLVGSIAAAPKKHEDWLLAFTIKFGDGTKLSTPDWLNSLCDDFFSENEGFFQKLPGSSLYHPVPSTVTRQPMEYYTFCGQILAKCVVEAMLRGACTRLSGIKFTKSFLAYMLGFPIHYKYLETDEPSYFREVRPIIESDLTNGNYMFTTLPNSHDSMTINLLPNGSDIPVSNENKEHYFDLLTKHRLIHTVEQEVNAIRSGFYNVLDKDYLCDFHKEDLQMLISGGRHFDVNELIANHRVVREVDTGYARAALRRQVPLDPIKILKWFFTAVQNMSEKERSYLLFFTTGSHSLPSCGFSHLNPIFCINLSGSFNEVPRGHHTTHEIILGDHINFDHFESALLFAIRPEAERIALPPTLMENRMSLYDPPPPPYAITEGEDTDTDLDYGGNAIAGAPAGNGNEVGWTESITSALSQDPIVNWLKEMINL